MGEHDLEGILARYTNKLVQSSSRMEASPCLDVIVT